MKKKENLKFKLMYVDGEVVDTFTFKTESYYDIIELADSKLEQAVWGSKIDMKKEEIRTWKRLDATTYRANYTIPKEVMVARFNMCVDIIKNHLLVKTEDLINDEKLNKTTEEFFS